MSGAACLNSDGKVGMCPSGARRLNKCGGGGGCPGNCSTCCSTFAFTIGGSVNCNGTITVTRTGTTCLYVFNGFPLFASLSCDSSTSRWVLVLTNFMGQIQATFSAAVSGACPPTNPAAWRLDSNPACGGSPAITGVATGGCP